MLKICFDQNIRGRPSAKQLIDHPFFSDDTSISYYQKSVNTGSGLNNSLDLNRKYFSSSAIGGKSKVKSYLLYDNQMANTIIEESYSKPPMVVHRPMSPAVGL